MRLEVREAAIVALLERGGPMTIEELAERLESAGVEVGSGDMVLSIRKAWQGRIRAPAGERASSGGTSSREPRRCFACAARATSRGHCPPQSLFPPEGDLGINLTSRTGRGSRVGDP